MYYALRRARYRRLKELREAISDRIQNYNTFSGINVLNVYNLGLFPLSHNFLYLSPVR